MIRRICRFLRRWWVLCRLFRPLTGWYEALRESFYIAVWESRD